MNKELLEQEWEKHSAKAVPPMDIHDVSKHHFTQGFKAASTEPVDPSPKKTNKRCYQCGGIDTIRYQNVKDKMRTPWRHLDAVDITVDLYLNYCEVCGNTPMWSEDGKMLDKAVEDSLCKKYLMESFVIKNGEDFYVSKIEDYTVRSFSDSIYDAVVLNSEEAKEFEFDGKYSEMRGSFYHINIYCDLLNNKNSNSFLMGLTNSILQQTIKERR